MQERLLGFENNEKLNSYLFYALVCAVLACVLFLSTYVFALVKVEGSSMNNTLVDGDVVFINKLAKYERGDIIVAENPDPKKASLGEMVIKRVIAIGGDEVKCENGKVYVKYSGESEFVELKEDYLSVQTPPFPQLKIDDGFVFVLGDNRPISQDSKIYGPIEGNKIKGVVLNSSVKNKKVTTALFGWTFNLSRKFKGNL